MQSSQKQKPIPVETEEGLDTAIEERSVSSVEGREKKQQKEQICDHDVVVESSLVQGPAKKQPIDVDERSVSSDEGGEAQTI